MVQWLVKKALETREEMTQEIRSRALFEFGKVGQTPDDEAFAANAASAGGTIQSVNESYKPRRQFKAPAAGRGVSEQNRVHSTLLEYGRRYGLSRPAKKDAKSDIAKALEGEEDEDAAALEEKRIKTLLKGMSQAGEGSISASALGSIVGLQSQVNRLKQMNERK